MVLFFIAFYTAPFSSKHFFLGLFVRSFFTQQFFLVVLLLLLLSMTALSYVGLLSLFWVRLFHAVFPEPSSTELFSWVVVFWAVCRAWIHSLVSVFAGAHSLAFLSLGVPFLGICRAVFIYLVLFCSFFFWGLSLFSDWANVSAVQRAHFSHAYFMGHLLPCFSFWFCSSSTLYIGLLCLLRMHSNSCEGDTWRRLWWDDITCNGKRVVNRLKIPQGLSTLMFRRWSEVPSRGGVRGDSP